jgi:hypothetical protein
LPTRETEIIIMEKIAPSIPPGTGSREVMGLKIINQPWEQLLSSQC